MLKYLRWLLLPFSLMYGLVVVIRNWCYNAGIFKSSVFSLPVISVGNLDIGGAGKTPMTEYLIRLLKKEYKLATLSRGYGRQSKGFLMASATAANTNMAAATQLGDEPAQFKQKFPDITVAVSEKRVTGIEQLQSSHEVIILDDAYQHRAVKPGLSILLFDYNRVSDPHLLLPAGNMREPFWGRKRANMLVVAKCPPAITSQQQARIVLRLMPYPGQQVFFTSISYGELQNIDGSLSDAAINNDTVVFLLTGIANPVPLVKHIKKRTQHVIHHNYPDHHQYTLKNIAKLAREFNACDTLNKIIITTEKDAQRLLVQQLVFAVKQLPVLVWPIAVKFIDNGNQFDQTIKNYVREYTTNH